MSNIPMPTETTGRTNYKMGGEELKDFMNRHGLSAVELASILGITRQAVNFWMVDEREMSVTITRLIKVFDKYPQLLKEF